MARLHHCNWKAEARKFVALCSAFWVERKACFKYEKTLILRSWLHLNPSQTLPETFQNRPQIAQEAPKKRPRGPKGTQETPKSAPGTPKRHPRGAPERPRAPERRPRTARTRPRGGLEAPKPSQNEAQGAPKARIGRFMSILRL